MFQTPPKTRQARRLRTDTTGAETRLWAMLRNRQFDGLKFRRQTPVAGHIADFLCPDLKLIIELDGGIHRLKEATDTLRDARLKNAGFTVLRFDNQAFLRNPNVVLDAIRGHAAAMLIQPPQSTGSKAALSQTETDA